MTFEPNAEGLQELYNQLGNRVREAVNETARDTADQDLESAVDLLHARLNGIGGYSFPRGWSQNALVEELLRRGDKLEIRLQ